MCRIDGETSGAIFFLKLLKFPFSETLKFPTCIRKLDIFGERFEVSKDLVYSYVRAQIVTKLHAVQLYLGNDIVDTFEYRMLDDLLPEESLISLG